MVRAMLAIQCNRIFWATLMLWACSTDRPLGDLFFATDEALSIPSIGSEEHLRLCLAPESLSPARRALLDAKVPAAVLEKAVRSSVLVTFDTLYPNKQDSCLKTCSGTLIKVKNKTKVLTNQHCFSDNFIKTESDNLCAYDQQKKADTFSNPCANTFAHINFPANEQQTISLACQGGFANDKELDLAIFDVDADSLPADHPHAIFWQGEITTDQEAFLLHHPNCGGSNFMIIPGTSIGAMIKTITFDDCRLVTPPAGTDAILPLQSNTFHSCITLPMVGLTQTTTDDAGKPITKKYDYGHGTSISAAQDFIAEAP